MESHLDWHQAKALLEWQVELGVSEAVEDAPVNRFELDADAPWSRRKMTANAPVQVPVTGIPVPPDAATITATAVQAAREAAGAAADLGALQTAMAEFELCELKRGARSLVFGDGNPSARVLVLGEAPGRDEDREGRPLVGPAGRLFDQMMAAIGLDRRSEAAASAVYVTNVVPWRARGNNGPEPDEIAMMLPFVERHITLVAPEFVVLMGNSACQAALGRSGILNLRGHWTESFGRPTLAMTHPEYLLRNPAEKRAAWADLLSLRARLGEEV